MQRTNVLEQLAPPLPTKQIIGERIFIDFRDDA